MQAREEPQKSHFRAVGGGLRRRAGRDGVTTGENSAVVSVGFWERLVSLPIAGMIVLSLAGAANAAGSSKVQLGPFGPEGPRMREQLWMMPSGLPGLALRATLFRPDDNAPVPAGTAKRRPLVVINHGTSESTRQSVGMPIYFWLSRWFVERGYVVVLPQRRGHGATGGELAEGRDSCSQPNHHAAGQSAADDIEGVVDYMAQQDFIAAGETIVAGISTGGWASLALAARGNGHVRAVVNFAGGRGGHAWGRPSQICDAEQLIATAGRFGATSITPSLWLYAGNDTFFGPALARSMARAFTDAGGTAELHVLPAYGQDGHTIADDQDGWRLWGRQLSAFLSKTTRPAPVMARTPAGKVPETVRAGQNTPQRIPVSLQ